MFVATSFAFKRTSISFKHPTNFQVFIHLKDMLKFQLHSDLINPCPKKFVQKLEINDSNQGFCEGVGKKKEQCPENQQLMDWSAGFLGQILSFFQAANPPDTDYESAEEPRLRGERWGGRWRVVGQLISKKQWRCSVLCPWCRGSSFSKYADCCICNSSHEASKDMISIIVEYPD